jgi:SAM-dependent methyltransferase
LHFLKEKKSDDLDAPSTTLEHREILLRKPFLRKLYEEWYGSFIDQIDQLPLGAVVEIGSGGGFLGELYPDAICSDVLPLPHCDMTFSAENMPFGEGTVSAIFMLDVLHHIPDCEAFFKEAERVLAKGGEIVMIEPANTLWSRFVYKNFHHEPFAPDETDWKFRADGPLSGANGALPWMVFRRDVDRFHRQFSSLALQSIKEHTPIRYLLSGGFTYKSLFPGWSFTLVSLLERLLAFSNRHTAMFQRICVQKK